MISEATHLPIIDGPLRHFSGAAEIDAPQSAVWPLWSEPRRWAEWGIRKSAPCCSPARCGKARRAACARPPARPRRALGAPCKFEMLWVDRTRGYGFVTRLPFARLRIEREWLGGGGTGVQHEIYFEGLLALVWARILGPHFQRGLGGALANLKRIAEEAQ